jgi:cell division protein FtsW
MNKIDRKILFPVMALVLAGIFIFLSASLTYLKNPENFNKIFFLQLIAILLGSSFIYFIQKSKYINYLTIKNNSIYLFFTSLIIQLLVLIPFFGVEKNGSTRWLDIGFMTVQPSELFRFATILFLANILFI